MCSVCILSAVKPSHWGFSLVQCPVLSVVSLNESPNYLDNTWNLAFGDNEVSLRFWDTRAVHHADCKHVLASHALICAALHWSFAACRVDSSA